MKAVFPQSCQTSKPWLETWLRDRHHNRAKTLVEAELAGGVTDDNKVISAVVQALQVDRIELDPVREYLDQPWIRVLDASPKLNHAEVRRGIYPGQRYKLAYDRYRLRLVSGAELVTLAANGGPAMLDSTFVGYVDGCIEIRASDDRHRDQLIGWVEIYIVEANRIIDKWNGPNLDQLVRNEVRRQQQQRSAAEQRNRTKEDAGFVRAAPAPPPRRLPLPDRKRASPTPPPAQRPDGVRYALEDDQFEAILEALGAHRNAVERTPGAGAPPEASEERHRDQVLASLGQRFRDGTSEAFSRAGKTDLRLLVDEDCFFYGEAKIWDGPSSVDAAVDQLLGRYLIPRDRHGALIFFIRNRANPNRIPAKAINRLIENHDGTRVDDVAGFPIIRTPVPGGSGRVVDLAVVTIVVDTSP